MSAPTKALCLDCREHPSTVEYRWLRHDADGRWHRILYWHGGVWSLCGERQFGDKG